MERERIIKELSQYFNVRELVCDHTNARWGERSWQFLDTNYLHSLLIIRRDILMKGMTCNNSTHHQRGLRCNMCNLVSTKQRVYLSAHILGKAGDFIISGMTAAEARARIMASADMLPCRIRLEDSVDWLHFDVLPTYGTDDKVTLFTD